MFLVFSYESALIVVKIFIGKYLYYKKNYNKISFID